MGFVYGPVPSRRLGQSLGIDPIPFKTCNYNCVYCQLGRTSPVTHERRDFFSPEAILSEVESALGRHQPGEIEFLTFVGQGEPLLCASLGRLVRAVKTLSDVPLAVITNGSLLFMPEVRRELLPADVVIPTLDAADEVTFRRINRPWPNLRVDRLVAGLECFRREFTGDLWVEVMLVQGLNDTGPVLSGLAEALERIQPDRIQLNIPMRPPAEPWVKPADSEGLEKAMTMFGAVAEVVPPPAGMFDIAGQDSVVEGIVEILRRHPMRERELDRALRHLSPESKHQAVAALNEHAAIRRRVYHREIFWTYAEDRSGRRPGSPLREGPEKGGSRCSSRC